MPKTLKEILRTSNDLFRIHVDKPSKIDPSTWTFKMDDSRWTDESFKDYTFRPVYLRRDNSFFLAYKADETNAYFVDPKRSMYRNSISTYVNVLVEYSVKSNDISKTKNEPSKRITAGEMKNKKINNFLDLCYEYSNYTAIGTGYNRITRNLMVMDIDVDCTRPDNEEELNNILLLFAKYDALPDFYIFNHQSNHVQLQWLIQNLQYKNINMEVVNSIINELKNDPEKNKELDYRKVDFTEISKLGVQYRRITLALCNISKKKKFGDTNYTFWKAKNPMSALMGIYDLELKMPYYSDGEIKYLSKDDMLEIFSSKEKRKLYFENAPDFQEWCEKLSGLMDPLVKKVTEKKVMKIEDANDVSEISQDNKIENKPKKIRKFGKSRNAFVLSFTRYAVLDVSKKYGYRNKEDIHKLSHEQFDKFRREVYDIVYQEFKKTDEFYDGVWPETTNISSFTTGEFKKTFNSAWDYSMQNINNVSYTNEDREKSQRSRWKKKEIKLFMVDKIKNTSTKITRKELLNEVNRCLKELRIRAISMGSLKRFIAESNELTDEERQKMNEILDERKQYFNSKKS